MSKAKIIGSILFTIFRLFVFRVEQVYGFEETKSAASSAVLIDMVENNQKDTRVIKLEAYLKDLDSPLVDNAEDFVAYADTYGYGENWSMIAAIAGVESTFGKFIPQNSYNAWGWGIPTGHQSGIGFSNWEEGIREVTNGIRVNYMDRGAKSLSDIGRIYAPPSNTWAGNVAYFMNEIESTHIEPSLSL